MRKIIALAAVAALAGCGGGGGASPTSTVPNQNPTTQTPTTTSFQITLPGGSKSGSATTRAPKFVSGGTAQIRVVVNSVNGGTPPSWVTTNNVTPVIFAPAASSNCTDPAAPPVHCTITAPAPPGTVNYTFSTEDTGGAHVLARHTQDVTITQGTNNTPTITLNGVVATVSVTPPSLAANTSQTGTVITWSAADASSTTITGSATFDNAVTLTDNDATGQTLFHVNGGAGSTTAVLTKPTDVLTLDYTGQADNPFTITATGTGISGGPFTVTPSVFDVTFTGTTLDNAANGGLNTDPNFSRPTLFFAQPSGSQNVTGAEVGWTNTPFSKQFDLDPGNGTAGTCGTGGGIATFSASPATTFTITATGVGICSVRLKEHGTGYPITTHPAPANTTDTTHDGTFYISVTASSFTVNGHRRTGQ